MEHSEGSNSSGGDLLFDVKKKHRPDPKGVCVLKMSVLMPMLPDIYFPSFRECQDSAAEYRDPRRLFQNPCMPHQS